MIHQLLSLTRPLFVIDTETTGTDVKADRIVELGFQLYAHQFPGDGPQKEWRSLINPGIPIPASATKKHGIMDAAMMQCQTCLQPLDTHLVGRASETSDPACITPKRPPIFKQLAANLAKGFSDCDYAGKNVRFDLRILAAEMMRAGQPWSYAGARVVDIDRLEQIAEPRSLSHLHKKYVGHPHDNAHGAISDVRASVTVLVHQLKVHQQLPRDLDQLHDLQWPGWLCDGGEFRMVDGVATCQFGKWRGRAMRDIPVSYFDWLLSAEFPADVKALAADAKLGKFPDGTS